MATPIHGRAGKLYAAITSGGTAEAIANLNKWSANFGTDDVETTVFGDGNKTYVAGLPDASGSFSGYFDTASAQLYTAATDGAARKFYLYPSTPSTAGPYWFGTGLFDFNVETGIDQAVTISGNWKASSTISKVG